MIKLRNLVSPIIMVLQQRISHGISVI